MSTTYIAMIVAILMGIGLLVGIGALSLLSGALNFLFVKPKITFLKSEHGTRGFAFTFSWDQSAEPVSFDKVKIHLFNPFGSPEQLEIIREFDSSSLDFARDILVGDQMYALLTAKGLDKGTVEIEVISSRDNVTHLQSYKGQKFLDLINEATQSLDDVAHKFVQVKEKPLFEIPERTFISPPLPKSAKALKLATNPIFAGEFAGGGSAEASGAAGPQNFSVTKVWIEPGCIVCDACEGIFPEVFEVTDSTCIIRPGAPLDDGLRIQESAEACPVEVIKFTKAS